MKDVRKNASDAISASSTDELRQALAELETQLLSLYYHANFPYADDMRTTIHQQFSRFCKSEGDADATIRHYARLNVTLSKKQDDTSKLWVVYSTKDQQSLDHKIYRKGQHVDSINMRKVALRALS